MVLPNVAHQQPLVYFHAHFKSHTNCKAHEIDSFILYFGKYSKESFIHWCFLLSIPSAEYVSKREKVRRMINLNAYFLFKCGFSRVRPENIWKLEVLRILCNTLLNFCLIFDFDDRVCTFSLFFTLFVSHRCSVIHSYDMNPVMSLIPNNIAHRISRSFLVSIIFCFK